MAIYGFARVSTDGQTLDVQIDQLTAGRRNQGLQRETIGSQDRQGRASQANQDK
jgi:DNA invertase Pin-like site-specific DNA recombinase